MKKFLTRIICCGGNNQTQQSAITRVRENNQDLPQRQENNEQRSEKVEIQKKKLIKVDTKILSSNITCTDFRQGSGNQYKYNCPICFRFFNNILMTSCCQNYICRFCADDINQKLSQNSANLEARCPFCNNMEFILKDVHPDEKPKRYTDSPAVTIKSRCEGSFQQEQSKSQFHTQTKKLTATEKGNKLANKGIDTSKPILINHLNFLFHDVNEFPDSDKDSCKLVVEDVPEHTLEEIIDQYYHVSKKRLRPVNPLRNSTILEASIEMEAPPHLPQNIICKQSYPGISNRLI